MKLTKQISPIILTLLVSILILMSCENNSSINQETPKFNDSLEMFNHYVGQYPQNIDPLYYRSQYFLRNGDVAGANQDLSKAFDLDSNDLRLHNAYAKVQMAQLNLEKVKYHYNYVVERDSQNVEALLGLAQLYALLNNFQMANFVYLNKVIEIDPYNAQAYFLRGIIYRADFEQTGREESMNRALSSFQTTVEQNPDFYSAYVEMGVMYDMIDSNVSINYYNSALEIFPKSTEALYNKGMYFQNRGYVDSALAQYHKILRIDSSYTNAYYNQGYIHLVMTGVTDSAVFYFEKSIERDPANYNAYNNLGLSYEKLGNYDLARTNYLKAIELYPDFKLAKENLKSLQ